MSKIQREIEITAADGGFSRVMDDMATKLGRSFDEANEQFERLNGNTSDFEDVLSSRISAIGQSVEQVYAHLNEKMDEQNIKGAGRNRQIKEEITSTERLFRIESDRAKLAEKMRFQNKMRDLNANPESTTEEKKEATNEHRQKMQEISEADAIRVLQIRGLRANLQQDSRKSDDGGDDGGDDKKQQNSDYGASKVSGSIRSVMSGVLSGLGVAGLFSIAGFIGKMLNEGIQLDDAQSSTRGLGMKGVGGVAGYGKKTSEMLQYSRETAIAAGRADYQAVNNLAFEKRFSQDENSLLGLTSGLRTEGRGRRSGDVAIEMLNYFKRSDLFNVKRGDFTQLGEKIQFNTRMLEMQGGQMVMTNATTNAQLLELFGKAGIGDQRTMGYVESINQSITNPNNDFSKAFIMRSLRQTDPNASLFELLKKQEQGIFGEGSFGQILGDLKRTFQGDQLKMSISQLFGVKNFQAEQIANLRPEDAAKIGSKEDIEKFLKDQGESPITMQTGQGGVGVMSRRMAELNDWFAENGVKAIHKIDDYINTFEKQGFGGLASQMVKDITGAIEEGFKKATDYLKEQFSPESIDKKLGLDKTGVLGQDGKPLPGTTSSVGNIFDAGNFVGGGDSAQQRKNWLENFDYDQSKLMPPSIGVFQPSYSRNNSGFARGKDFVVMEGNELSGKFAGREVEAELPDNSYGQQTAAQIAQLFAYAIQNGLEKITLEQSKMILEQGFQPSIEIMKEMKLNNTVVKNKTYSTEH